MLDIELKASNRIELTASGRIDAEQMHAALDRLFTLIEPLDHFTYLADMRDIQVPTAGAFWEELKQIARLPGLLRKLDKAAVVTNQDWLAKAAQAESMLIPGLTVKTFGQHDRARVWLSGTDNLG